MGFLYDMFIQNKEHWLNQKWGRVRLEPSQPLLDAWSQHSKKKLVLLCDCGRSTLSSFSNVTRGGVTSCGRCTYKSKIWMLSQVWGSLTLDPSQFLPDEIPPSSGKPLLFNCSCGKLTFKKFCDITYGRVVSCGHCNDRSKDYWLAQTWGKYSLCDSPLLPEVEFNLMSNKKFHFKCSCGRTNELKGSWVLSGNATSCGKCNWIKKKEWIKRTWGKLRLDPNQLLSEEWGIGISNKLQFICNCGRTKSTTMFNVEDGRVTSCGRCDWKSKGYWLGQKWGGLHIDPSQGLPEEWGVTLRVGLLCDCGGRITSNLFNVVQGRTVSCGCSKGQGLFSPENEVRNYVLSLAGDTHPSSYPIPNSRKTYDIYTPSNGLAVEYHGLVWHSEKFNKTKSDYRKYQLARSRGDKLIQIYSDEWQDKQEIMKEMLRSRLQSKAGKRIKPTFELYRKTPPEARAFLDKHHYLGAASGCVTIIARHGSAVVGVWVFMKREIGTVLWHRACWDHSFKTWNPHEKALSLALPELRSMGFQRMVTFSDNRFHTGELYEKLGFTFEEEIPPDYGYTNGTARKSKYALRVKAGINEVEAAKEKGWYRIWDSGKNRYSIPIYRDN